MAIAKTLTFLLSIVSGCCFPALTHPAFVLESDNQDLLMPSISLSTHWIHMPYITQRLTFHTDYGLSNFNLNKITNLINSISDCLHASYSHRWRCCYFNLISDDAFDSSSIAYGMTIYSHGLSRYNEKCLLLGNNPLIMLRVSGDCNSSNYFPWAKCFLFHPKLVSIHYFGYFIIKKLSFLLLGYGQNNCNTTTKYFVSIVVRPHWQCWLLLPWLGRKEKKYGHGRPYLW